MTASEHAAARATRQRRTVATSLVLLLIAALTLAGFARAAGRTASQQRNVAQADEMANEATDQFSADDPLAMLLSLQAYERARTLQTTSAMIEAAGQPLGDLLTEGSRVYSVAFSPDGQTLAAGDDSGHVGLWDTATGKQIATLAQGSEVNSVAFSPDGRTLAASDGSGHVGLWDTATGKQTAILTEGSSVNSVAFSPNGWTLADGDVSGDVVLRRQSLSNLTYGFFSRLICSEVRGNMTKAQWAANAAGQPYQKTCPAYP